ncbi:MAG TPA: hypothetical protein VK809_09600 [Bacteroidia bacterium]|nr:hypothetical protein [Bacteroidia bacterium]
MKKSLLIIFVFSAALLNMSIAQTDTSSLKKHSKFHNQSPWVSVNAGLSIPTGDFASRLYSGIASNTNGSITTFRGWATLGETISFQGSVPIFSKFGINIGFKIGYNQLPFDITTYEENGNAYSYSKNQTLVNTDWKLYSFLAGVSWVYYSHKMSIEGSFFVGESYAASPNETLVQITPPLSLGYPYTSYDTTRFSSSKNNCFVGEAQVAFKYFICRSVFLGLNVSYLTSFSNINYNGGDNSNNVIQGSTPVSMVDITLGVGISFEK